MNWFIKLTFFYLPNCFAFSCVCLSVKRSVCVYFLINCLYVQLHFIVLYCSSKEGQTDACSDDCLIQLCLVQMWLHILWNVCSHLSQSVEMKTNSALQWSMSAAFSIVTWRREWHIDQYCVWLCHWCLDLIDIPRFVVKVEMLFKWLLFADSLVWGLNRGHPHETSAEGGQLVWVDLQLKVRYNGENQCRPIISFESNGQLAERKAKELCEFIRQFCCLLSQSFHLLQVTKTWLRRNWWFSVLDWEQHNTSPQRTQLIQRGRCFWEWKTENCYKTASI